MKLNIIQVLYVIILSVIILNVNSLNTHKSRLRISKSELVSNADVNNQALGPKDGKDGKEGKEAKAAAIKVKVDAAIENLKKLPGKDAVIQRMIENNKIAFGLTLKYGELFDYTAMFNLNLTEFLIAQGETIKQYDNMLDEDNDKRSLGVKVTPFPAAFANYPVNWATTNNSLNYAVSANVGNQEGCKNCWAHAAAGLYDAFKCLSYSDCTKKISVSYLTACSPSHSIKQNGCLGGNALLAMGFLRFSNTVKYREYYNTFANRVSTLNSDNEETFNTPNEATCPSEDDYGFSLAKLGYNLKKVSLFSWPMALGFDNTTGGYTYNEKITETVANYLYNYGPAIVRVDIKNWQFLSNDGTVAISDPSFCSRQNSDHTLLLVGWNVNQNGEKYWILKNSWGKEWGYNGFINVMMKDDICNIAATAVFMSAAIDAPADRRVIDQMNFDWLVTAANSLTTIDRRGGNSNVVLV